MLQVNIIRGGTRKFRLEGQKCKTYNMWQVGFELKSSQTQSGVLATKLSQTFIIL